MLEINKVAKAFGKRIILNDLSIKIENGKMVGVFGESGSGKTTLLKIISTMLEADSGVVAMDSTVYSNLSKRKKEAFRLNNIALVSSDLNLLSPLTARENVLFPLELQKLPFNEAHFSQVSADLKLSPLLDEVADSLSSGEKQRVAIFRALMLDKPILIADEPTSHLDPEMSIKVMDILKKETQSSNKITICSCHDETLLPYFDELYTLNGGRLLLHEN